MTQKHFDLNTDQTLRLEELRKILTAVLPAGVAKTIEFPVTHYAGCGAVCMPGCTGSCTGQCRTGCSGSCIATCRGSCADTCYALGRPTGW